MTKFNQAYKTILSETDQAAGSQIKYTVELIGSEIGSKQPRTKQELKGKNVKAGEKTYDTIELAKITKDRMMKQLSPGEKKYYGLKYVVAEVVDGKYTGK